jgi:hypothetical protein
MRKKKSTQVKKRENVEIEEINKGKRTKLCTGVGEREKIEKKNK